MPALGQYDDVHGELRWPDHGLTITCTITISNDGTITINTEPIVISNETAWILQQVPGNGRLATWASLHATTADGERIETDYVTMTGRGSLSATMPLHGEASRLTIHHRTSPATAAGCTLIYHTIGMQGFQVQQATTPLGLIQLLGPAEIEDYDHLAGTIRITAPEDDNRPLDEWRNDCDENIRNILLIVSLAEGKLLEWSIRTSAHDKKAFTTDCYGPKHTGTPRDGIFHWLHLQPVLDLAINNYPQPLRETTGIELAIRLLLAQPAHVELQLISAMTALEHLISVYTREHPIPVPLVKDVFATVRSALETTYDTTTAAIERPANADERDKLTHAIKRVRDRIGNLNDTNFNDRLFTMLKEYDVPLVGIQAHITKAVKARHDIIHTGTHQVRFPEFYRHVAVLRELVKRTILTLLRYEGQYISFLNGQEFLEFPPTNVTIT